MGNDDDIAVENGEVTVVNEDDEALGKDDDIAVVNGESEWWREEMCKGEVTRQDEEDEELSSENFNENL